MANQNEIRQQITNQIITELESNTVPFWRRPWRTSPNAGRPTNVASIKTYNGINPLLLELHSYKFGFQSKYWGMRAVLKNLRPEEKQVVLRLGTSLDPLVKEVTLGGKLSAQNATVARTIAKAQERLRQIREMVQNRSLSHERLHALFAEAQTHEKQLKEFNEKTLLVVPQLLSSVLVTGCTLAKMVLDADLRTKPFDVVIVDEASMASLLFALAASLLATQHLVYAGDPKQLPPIVQAKGQNAAKWFGQNVYDWFGIAIRDDVRVNGIRLLRTQYRMTNEIGGVVSRLGYGGLLKHGRGASGPKIEFIDIDGEWQTTHYSVQEESYFHLAAVPTYHVIWDDYHDWIAAHGLTPPDKTDIKKLFARFPQKGD